MRLPLPLLLAALLLLPGCRMLEATALGFVYVRADLPEARVLRDLPYVDGPEAHPTKHRLDLFLPLAEGDRASGWPTVVFVHGGGWNEGDKGLTFGGEDVYGNVGRYLAQRGIGAAVVNYRLLPEVAWPAQVDDVARAVAWVHRHVGGYGGDPEALFLMGHSAGAQLAARVALDPDALGAVAVPAGAVCGVIPVSGAALDLTDRESFVLADNFDYYARRFGPRGAPVPKEPPAEPLAWQRDASVLPFVGAEVPPFLILYAGGESRALQRQSRLLHEALQAAGAPSELVVVPGQSHTRIVPTLSRDGRTAGPAVVAFVRGQDCS